ncbi:MAG: hypothetical protein H7Y00_09185 [Fimbriimonadaceae bacterium]|nr:hypothetical protein [Chitinophagales bacterium]
MVSCSKETPQVNEQITDPTSLRSVLESATDHLCDSIVVVDLVSSTGDVIGLVFVGNTDDELVVGYVFDAGYEPTKTYLYAGDCDLIPMGPAGPRFKDFPYQASHVPGTTLYAYTISLDDVDECMCIVAMAKFNIIGPGGHVSGSGVAWGEGTSLGGILGAMYFEYCECID